MKYRSIVFLQDSEADEPLDLYRNHGPEAAIAYLKQWDYGDGDLSDSAPWGTDDWVISFHRGDGYWDILSMNTRLGCIALTQGISEED